MLFRNMENNATRPRKRQDADSGVSEEKAMGSGKGVVRVSLDRNFFLTLRLNVNPSPKQPSYKVACMYMEDTRLT